MRILIAEDDYTSRVLLAAVLKKGGHEVTETVNGLEAWENMQKPDAPRLAILDWMMPVMDGLEVVQKIRSLTTEMPPYLILLTAKGEKADIVRGLDAGADDYLTKPFDHGELRARLEVGRRVLSIQERLASQIVELRNALDLIKTLQGILPICSFCKKIRDEKGGWSQLEAYISSHSEARFSHSICPACLKNHYPEFSKHEDKNGS